MPPVLPWRLPPVLPSTYSPSLLNLAKDKLKTYHSDSPHHAFAHCGVCAPAARRSARALVSVPFSGLILTYPLRVKGMVGRYPAICLIRRSLIVERYCSNSQPFRLRLLPGVLNYMVLASVSQGYPLLYGRLTTRY